MLMNIVQLAYSNQMKTKKNPYQKQKLKEYVSFLERIKII